MTKQGIIRVRKITVSSTVRQPDRRGGAGRHRSKHACVFNGLCSARGREYEMKVQGLGWREVKEREPWNTVLGQNMGETSVYLKWKTNTSTVCVKISGGIMVNPERHIQVFAT